MQLFLPYPMNALQYAEKSILYSKLWSPGKCDMQLLDGDIYVAIRYFKVSMNLQSLIQELPWSETMQ